MSLTETVWYTVARSDEVTGKPVPVQAGGDEIVLFRDRAGTVHAVEDRCPHRRVPLSLGWVTGEGTLQCGYHGWCWDGATGQCAQIPNYRPGERVPSRFAVRTYDVTERDGQILVCTGVGAAVPTRAAGGWFPSSVALRDAWFPVAHTPQVRPRPVRRQIHGQPYWLWRDGGRLRAVEFHPDELNARRSAASEFTGGTGEYPLVERYGYAWVWYGNPEHADTALVPDVPYLPRNGKLPRWFWGTYIFHSTYELVCENLLDLTHADFLHSKLVGDPLSDDDQISVESTSETVTMIREARGRVTPPAFRAITRAKRQDLRAVTFVHLRSGVCILHGNFSPGLSVRLFHPNVPDSTRTTRLDFTFNPKGGHALARNAFPLCAPAVARQDDRMLRPQNPRYLQPSERADFSSRFDTAGLTYRKRMKELAERQSRGDYSYGSDCDPGADIAKLLDVERED